MKKIFLATNNHGKIERYTNLLHEIDPDIKIYTPKDFGLENVQVEEIGKTLAENAEIKARSYFGKVSMPILSNDTGFYVAGEGLVEAPKRVALKGMDEATLSKEEMAKMMLDFWKNVAKKHGGKVDAHWQEVFVVFHPDGTVRAAESKREVILTDQEFGEPHIQLPVRALYISKASGKPALHHTREEELLEMQPIVNALQKIVSD